MKLAITGKRDLQRNILYQLLFRGLSGGYTPILLTGDRGFDLYGFLRARKRARFPIHLVEKIQFACAVNGHHIKPLIEKTGAFEPTKSFTIFLDFTSHYLDDTVSEGTRKYMFMRDLGSIHSLEEPLRPVFFFEGGSGYRGTLQEEFRKILLKNAKIHLEENSGNFSLKKFALTEIEREDFFFGTHNSSTHYLCQKLSQRWKQNAVRISPKNTSSTTMHPINGNRDTTS